MLSKRPPSSPILNLTQLLVLLAVAATLMIVLDLNKRSQAGRNAGISEESLQNELLIETTHQAELQATLTYVESDDYIADYARNEAGYILPGEKRVVPLVIPISPSAPPLATPTPDPALNAHPWQAWFRLLTDIPQPSR